MSQTFEKEFLPRVLGPRTAAEEEAALQTLERKHDTDPQDSRPASLHPSPDSSATSCQASSNLSLSIVSKCQASHPTESLPSNPLTPSLVMHGRPWGLCEDDEEDPPPEPLVRRWTKEGQAARKAVRNMAESVDKEKSNKKINDVEDMVQGRFSHDNFWNPHETVLIVDWDDTLFPTTWIKYDNGLRLTEKLPEGLTDVKRCLEEVEKHAYEFLLAAISFSDHVVIVTLGQEPWITDCMKNFGLNSLKVLIEEKEIPIVYARSFASVKNSKEYDKKVFESNEEKIKYWASIKARAIARVCEKSYKSESWKNVISIGDSVFEQEGTRQAVKIWCKANFRTAYQLPRTKTVKFIDEPTAEELMDQLKLMYSWLPELVKLDEAFNIDLDGAGSDNLGGIMPLVTPAATDGDSLSQGPSSAIVVGRLWKLSVGGNPLCQDDWFRRRVWLSWKGQLWYESLEEAKPIQLLPANEGKLMAEPLGQKNSVITSIGGSLVSPFSVSLAKQKDSKGQGTSSKLIEHLWRDEVFLAASNAEDLEKWISAIQSAPTRTSPDLTIETVD